MADRVAAVSEAAARDLEALLRLPEGAAATLHNPIWPMAASAADPADVHRWLGEPGPVLVAVGRLVAPKNHLNLLHALALMRRQRPVRLILLGDGPLREELTTAAAALGVEDAVDFAGFRADVADFLRHSDLFVLSSDREGLPLSLMEALSVGTPVVATDCRSGPRELLQDGRFGTLVPVRDPAALAVAALDALRRSHDPARLQARAREFEAEAIVRRYEAVLFPGLPPWSQRATACPECDGQRVRTCA
jgi:glycosyltransferase involved in cell wall biosynthesis